MFQKLFEGKLTRKEFIFEFFKSLVAGVAAFMIFALLAPHVEILAYIFIVAALGSLAVYQFCLIKKRLKDVFPGTNSYLSLGVFFVVAAIVPFSSFILAFLPSDVLNKAE